MRGDIGEIIGLIAVGSGALVLVLSYVAAYMVGKSHGRREEQRADLTMDRLEGDRRLAAVEQHLESLDRTVGSLEAESDFRRQLEAPRSPAAADPGAA